MQQQYQLPPLAGLFTGRSSGWASGPASQEASSSHAGQKPGWASGAGKWKSHHSNSLAAPQHRSASVAAPCSVSGATLANIAANISGMHLPHIHLRKLHDMSGTWIKDKERSESMEAAMQLMQLSGLVRQAVKLVRGVKIEQDDKLFNFAVFSIISWFKVKEVYPLNGDSVQFKRRDLRRGKHTGHVQQHGHDLRLHLTWAAPFGGSGVDEFKLVNQDELHINSTIDVEGKRAQYNTVYRRKQ